MKKRIFLIAITVLTLALLSGCDAILEGFFPEFADTNSIDVHVISNGTPVIVALIPLDDFGSPMQEKYVKQRWTVFDFYASFDGLPNGDYKVYVWFDEDTDGHPNDSVRAYARRIDSIDTKFTLDSTNYMGEDSNSGECDLTTSPNEVPPAGL